MHTNRPNLSICFSLNLQHRSIHKIWEVYVSQPSNKSKEKGVVPTSSLIQAFISLAPSSSDVRVNPAVFHNQNKQKGKGHMVRCIQRERSDTGSEGGDSAGEIVSAMEIGNVDSVDKVYRIMTEHMKLGVSVLSSYLSLTLMCYISFLYLQGVLSYPLNEKEIDPKACDGMKCFFKGNQRLDEGKPSQAITLYDQALSAANRSSQLPKGSILMKRARAYLKRAANHRKTLRILVKDLSGTVPSAPTMKILYQTASTHPALSPSIFNRLAGDSKVQQAKFRQIRYRHDMYEFALLHSVQDSLEATQILPQNAQAWMLAGECLAELRKLKESNQYYQRALEIDPGMERTLEGAMGKNIISQEFMDAARASGFSGDTLRLALDVAA